MAVTKKAVKAVSTKANKEGVTYASLKDIEVERGFNVRTNNKPEETLLASVKENGVIRPAHVRFKSKKKDKFYLIDGHRRYEAAKAAGLGSIPVVSHGNIDDKAALIISLSSNENQKKLSTKERFEGFRRLKKEGLSPAQIAKVMAVDKRTVEEAMRIESKGHKNLQKAAVKSTKDGGVHTRVAARASSLPKKEQQKLLPKVKGKTEKAGLDEIRKVEKRVGIKQPGRKPQATSSAKPKRISGTEYKVADDMLERCEQMEHIIRKKLRYSKTHKVLNGQLLIIEVLKGKMAVTDLFGWDDVK
jgi:ParB/RepB/Spo0J family partition protein